MSAVGWVEVSSGALRRLERSLETNDTERGVVDELGVLAFHEKYAEDFFPGTSVLHRRARYLLFVPWTYLYLAKRLRGRPATELASRRAGVFRTIVRELKRNTDTRGIIGRDVVDPAQPPDVVYWSALRRYGLCSDVDRSRVLGRWDPERVRRPAPRTHYDEPEDAPLLELYVPAAPSGWPNTPFSFRLERDEAERLRDAVALPGRSLLSEAANMLRRGDRPTDDAEHVWSDEFMLRAAKRLGPTWESALTRAKHVAHLGQLARAVYAVHVEHACKRDSRERRPRSPTVQREQAAGASYEARLSELVRESEMIRFAARADFETDLDQRALGAPGFALFLHLRDRAKTVRSWADARAQLLDRHTRDLLEDAERARKGLRARLPIRDGRARRESFDLGAVSSEPLHYRWRVARTFLVDLQRGLFA